MVLPGRAVLECRSSEQLQIVRAADLQNVNMAFAEELICHSHVLHHMLRYRWQLRVIHPTDSCAWLQSPCLMAFSIICSFHSIA